MSVYAFKCIDLFFKKNLKKKIYFKKKDLNNLSENFQIKIKVGNFLLKCDFRFNSKYKNFIKIQNNKNILYLPMAFSQPLNSETYYINNGLKKKFKVENSFHKFLINLKDNIKKKKKFDKFYNEIEKLSKLRKWLKKKFKINVWTYLDEYNLYQKQIIFIVNKVFKSGNLILKELEKLEQNFQNLLEKNMFGLIVELTQF